MGMRQLRVFRIGTQTDRKVSGTFDLRTKGEGDWRVVVTIQQAKAPYCVPGTFLYSDVINYIPYSQRLQVARPTEILHIPAPNPTQGKTSEVLNSLEGLYTTQNYGHGPAILLLRSLPLCRYR